ncbi:Uncharacterized protein TCM_012376 [Theobroma cacao]|uniref:Uncharacterized protein n=1 Tax=Theobroma cacao TaxID=3641 RepID=A0A061G1Z7_THECC|nr:Uncharacterized protein TCM_012376 [Theobroma cacao]
MTELRATVFDIDKDSVARPNGFSSYFYQQCWPIIADDLLAGVKDFFNGAKLRGGLISDNILLTHKLVGKIDYKARGGNVILKLDMMKAHDRSCYLIHSSLKSRNASQVGKIKFSPGGRITILRNVLSSLPIYLLQVLNPSVSVIEKIERLFNSFLWGGSTDSKKIHWASWAKLTFPGSEGGLDIQSLNDVFEAFSAKLWWQFQACSNLWTQYIRTKYCTGKNPHTIITKPHDSPTWKRMISGRDKSG